MAKENIVGYTRVSSSNQEDNDSLKRQEDQIRQYATKGDRCLDKLFSDVHTGKRDDRLGFIEMMKYIKASRNSKTKRVHRVVVASVDRLIRDVGDYNVFTGQLYDMRLELTFLDDPEGLSEFDLICDRATRAAEAHIKGIQIGRQTKEGMLADRLEGIPPPQELFGYRVVQNEQGNTTYEVVEEQASIVRWAFRQARSGRTVAEIHREAKEYPYEYGAFNEMLRNPLYCAMVPPNKGNWPWGVHTKGNFPAIVEEHLFCEANRVLSLGAKRMPTRALPLSGVLRVEGHQELASTISVKNYQYYKFGADEKDGRPKGLPAEKVHKALITALQRVKPHPAALEMFLWELANYSGTPDGVEAHAQRDKEIDRRVRVAQALLKRPGLVLPKLSNQELTEVVDVVFPGTVLWSEDGISEDSLDTVRLLEMNSGNTFAPLNETHAKSLDSVVSSMEAASIQLD